MSGEMVSTRTSPHRFGSLTETLDLLVAVALAAVDVLVAVAAVVVVTALLVADVASVEDTAALLVAWTAPAAAP